jgi:hypothetical protein
MLYQSPPEMIHQTLSLLSCYPLQRKVIQILFHLVLPATVFFHRQRIAHPEEYHAKT